MAKVKVSAGMVFERYEKKYHMTEETAFSKYGTVYRKLLKEGISFAD